MRRILCFGDSNTWGSDPASFLEDRGYFIRYDEDTRWTSLLRKKLGADYDLVEEGQGGRTTVLDDPITPQPVNGYKYLVPCLWSHTPIDLVVLMLGTNDLKSYFSVTEDSIALANELLVKTVLETNLGVEGAPPKVLLMPPVSLGAGLEKSPIGNLFDVQRAVEIGKRLPELLRQVARRNGCHYLDSNDFAELSDIDHVHFTRDGHARLAEGVFRKIQEIFAR